MEEARLLLLTGQGDGGLLLDRKTNGKGGSASRQAVYQNFSPVFFYNAIGHGKSQTRALDTGLGGKERVKNIAHHLGGNPRSSILDLNLHLAIRGRGGNGNPTSPLEDRLFGVL